VRLLERDMFALDRLPKGPRLIKAQDLLAVIDEQIEVRKEVQTQYPAYARICGLELREVLNHCERLWDRMTSNLNQVKRANALRDWVATPLTPVVPSILK
jgi:hypothetical protein